MRLWFARSDFLFRSVDMFEA